MCYLPSRTHLRLALAFLLLLVLGPLVHAQPLNSTNLDLDGIWESLGYGVVLDIEDGEGAVYQLTAVSRYETDALVYDGLLLEEGDNGEAVPVGVFSRAGDVVTLTTPDGTEIDFVTIEAVPDRPITEATDDPVATFEVLWHAIDQHFSFFDLRPDVDWQAVYDEARPLLDAQTSDEDLFELLAAMLAPLGDGHGGLVAEDEGWGFDPRPPIRSLWMAERIEEVLGAIASTLDDGELELLPNGLMEVGTIGAETPGASVGYLATFGYMGYAEAPFDEAAAFAEALDGVLADAQDLDALILDLRFNPGGFDHLGRVLASRFVDQEYVAFQKQARVGGPDVFADLAPRLIAPEGVPFVGKPVVVLTSGLTWSAGEVQALTLRGLPNVLLVGEPTGGAFSNQYEVALPNGWDLTLSNERYVSRDGEQFEYVGVPPDVFEVPSEAALDEGRDNVLERALAEIAALLPTAGEPDALPETGVRLDPAYPNPFADTATLAFHLATAETVSVEVLDLLGRRVAQPLDRAALPAGT
ncbi:MAG: S41 family peptidase, partial [Bacteroidota bacterium]